MKPDSPVRALFDTPVDSLIRSAHEAIVMVDVQQLIVAMNPAAQRMFGCTQDDAVGCSLARFLPPGSRDAHAALVREAAAAPGVPPPLVEHRRVNALRADGEGFVVDLVISRVQLGAPAQPLFAAFMRDLTEEDALKGELALLRRRLRALFELAPTAIWIADNDIILYANQAAARLFGAGSAEALVGQSVYALLQRDSHQALREQMAQVLREQALQAGAADVAAAERPPAPARQESPAVPARQELPAVPARQELPAVPARQELPAVPARVLRADGRVREVDIALAALPDHGRTTVQMVVADVTRREAQARELERSRMALRRLSASVVEAREDERRRIARELHDELGQRLTALKMELSSCAAAAGVHFDDAHLADMLNMLDDAMASVRRISADLRPLMLDDLGLTAAIEWLAHDVSRRLAIPVQVHLDDVDAQLDERTATALYRMVQEALTNVARHARATQARVELRGRQGELVLTVSDNGVGLVETGTQRDGQFGLLGMRERAEMLGGRFEVGNGPDHGCRVCVHLPHPSHQPQPAQPSQSPQATQPPHAPPAPPAPHPSRLQRTG